MKNDNSSVLQMLDLYFSSISFCQKREIGKGTKLNIEYSIEHQRREDDESVYRTLITTRIKGDHDSIKLEVVAVGVFQIVDSNLDNELEEMLIKRNTVAIMFPYIRSQISILTSQPGIMPIQIPVVDVNKLIESNN